MSHFAYEARTEDGNLVSGVIAAVDLEEAGRKLSASNHFIVKLGLSGSNDPVARAKEVAAAGSPLKANRRSVMWFINQLAIMVETGIPIGEALECLQRQASEPVMREILASVSAAVHEGRPLSDALENFPRAFPNVLTATVRASEASGTLSVVLGRTAEYMIKDEQTVRRLRGSLMYPLFMFLMCICVTLFLMIVILPRFAQIYASKGAALPTPTRVLLSISDFVMVYGLHLLMALLVGGAAFYRFLKTKLGGRIKDETQLRMPLIGDVFNKFFQGRSFRTMGMLIEAGVPLSEVLELAQNMSSNSCYRRMWQAVEEGVTNGEHIASRMAEHKMIPESVIHMIDCGDRSGRLSSVLVRLAAFIEDEYDSAIKTLCQFVEPLMIVLMGSIIGFVAISLLLPMFGAGQALAK
jgi:type II secretory pathway component PulF